MEDRRLNIIPTSNIDELQDLIRQFKDVEEKIKNFVLKVYIPTQKHQSIKSQSLNTEHRNRP